MKIVAVQEFECLWQQTLENWFQSKTAIKVKAIEGDRLLPISQYLYLIPVKGSKLCSVLLYIHEI